MMPKAIDSLDLVEAVMVIEEIFGTDIPSGDKETFGSPKEIVDWLDPHLSNRRPNKQAAALLRKLAKDQNNPELARLGRGLATRTNCSNRAGNFRQ